MSDALIRDALRVIQDIVVQAKGSPLESEAERRVEAVLRRIRAREASPAPGADYSGREVTILFADLRGFSAIAAAYPADVVLSVLNRCFGMLTDIIARHYGTIDKFMGDAIMAIFYGDPGAPRDHARRAVLSAVQMQIAVNDLRQQHRQEHVPEVYLGIGMSTGTVMAGLIGSDAYRAFTVIGEEVNLASRIEAFSLRGQVLISEATYAHCRDFAHCGEPVEVYVKGRSGRVWIREVLGIPALGKVVPRQDVRKSPRVKVRLAFEYRLVRAKVVQEGIFRGVMRDIGYHGMLAELAGKLPLYAEITLVFDLPELDMRAEGIYGRVVSLREEDGRPLAGIEFTSLSAETNELIRLFVQMRIQEEAAAAGAMPAPEAR